MDEIIYELTNLAATWDRASAKYHERANRLGNCRAGEVAAAEASMARSCAEDLRRVVAVVFGAAATGREH